MSNRAFWSPLLRAWRRLWSGGGNRPRSRLGVYLNMLFVDHGVLRYLYANRFRVSDQLERRNHPSPWEIGRAARRGVKTIINLRGENTFGSYQLSKQACERYGIKMVDFRTYSRRLPTKEEVLAAKKLFDEVEYPVLMHCKAGADRAGLMSALYLILHEGKPVAEAKRQLHWRFGHVRHTKTGILDYFFEAYEKANESKPIDFLSWVEQEYDPDALQQAFNVRRWENLLDRILNRE